MSKIMSLFNVAMNVFDQALPYCGLLFALFVWLVKVGSEDAAKWRNNALWGHCWSCHLSFLFGELFTC